MQFLSIDDPLPEPRRRLTRAEALGVSLGLHLLVALFLIHGPASLPAWLDFLSPASSRAAAPPAAAAAQASPSGPPPAKAPEPERIPLRFTYVKVPNDATAAKNPAARLYSDKDRRARQDVATPPGARLSSDPHSEGDTIERVRPDAARPEGRESPDVAAGSARGTEGGLAQAEAGQRRDVDASAPGNGTGRLAESGPAALAPARPPSQNAGERAPGGDRAGTGGPDDSGALGNALREPPSGEYKFSFNNPAYLRGGAYGSLSFDTQGFPWGDYARRIHVILRDNWLARIPLAAREGIRGFVCWHFTIEKDGSVSAIDLVRSSSVPPFDKAANDALRASNFPPLPQDFPEPREGATYCFYYNMYPGEAD